MAICMTVSVVEHAHSMDAPTTSNTALPTNTILGNNHGEDDAPGEWDLPVPQRRRSSSLEAWLHKTFHSHNNQSNSNNNNSNSNDDPEAQAARVVRRHKRKLFFRKLFGRSLSSDSDSSSENSDTAPAPRLTADLSFRAAPPPPEIESCSTGSYRLDDMYYASIATILEQYKADRLMRSDSTEDEDPSDTESSSSTTDWSEVSIYDMQEDQAFDEEEEEEETAGALVAIPEFQVVRPAITVVQYPMYVTPPVRIPVEYTLHDRRGGTLVAGHTVLFTSAAFKRKQRQLQYQMRSIPEHRQALISSHGHQGSDDDNEEEDVVLVTDGILTLESDWV